MIDYAKAKLDALRRVRLQDVQTVLRAMRAKLWTFGQAAWGFARAAWRAVCEFSRAVWRARLLATMLLLVLLAAALWLVPRAVFDGVAWRHVSRAAGYLALIAIVFPYVHVARRIFRIRRLPLRRLPLRHQAWWLRWHIITAYAAFFFALLHCQGHAHAGPTFWLLLAFWTVMLSGVAGYFGQKLCYRLLALSVRREVGLERIVFERDRLLARAVEITLDSAWLRIEDVRDWAGLIVCPQVAAKLKGVVQPVVHQAQVTGSLTAELKDEILLKLNGGLKKKDFWNADGLAESIAARLTQLKSAAKATADEIERANRQIIEMLCPNIIVSRQKPAETLVKFQETIEKYLQTEFPTWSWLFSPDALEPVSRNHYARARELTVPEQRESIDLLWKLADRRRQLDMEYWFHRLAHSWLLLHGPAAVFMFVPLVIHVWGAIWSGAWVP